MRFTGYGCNRFTAGITAVSFYARTEAALDADEFTALLTLAPDGRLQHVCGDPGLVEQLGLHTGATAHDKLGVPFPLGARVRVLRDKEYAGQMLSVRALHDAGQTIWLLQTQPPFHEMLDALRNVATDTPGTSGEKFYMNLVSTVAEALQVKHAFIGLIEQPAGDHVQTLALIANGKPVANFRYELKGTPCAVVIDHDAHNTPLGVCWYPQDVCRMFPRDQLMIDMGITSYIGAPLIDNQRQPFGLLVVMDDQPLGNRQHLLPLFYAFASRAAAELLRDRAAAAQEQMAHTLGKRVSERTAELEHLNRELEAFSYSVSHDLRAPLRHIISFGSVMNDALSGGDIDEARDCGARMTAAAERLRAMIDALLNLSRVSRAELHVETVDMNTLVAQVRSELGADNVQWQKVQWQIDPLPALQVDAPLFRLVMQNLLENAIKYSATRGTPAIHVRSYRDHEQDVLVVSDNGVGFDMAHAEKLFQPFQRLHSPHEFAGEGIGLANVARIVHRHHGRIWAQAVPDQGAQFFIALPAAAGTEPVTASAAATMQIVKS